MRKIILYDMNYFYAQVEERDNPNLKGKPIAVGSKPEERGSIITTCNYLAREYGVRAGMPSIKGRELCQSLLFISPRMNIYYAIHKQIRKIIEKYSDHIEYVAMDEAYLDVTYTEWLFGGADKIALEIQKNIFEKTGLTCSIGVGYNKMSAKLSADKIKPNGYFNMDTREKFLTEMTNKKVKEIPGIGEKISLRLNTLGIYTIKNLQGADPYKLLREFKPVMTKWLQGVCEGYDNREVVNYYREKNIGRSVTLIRNTKDLRILKNTLIDIAKLLSYKLKKREEYATSIALKLRWNNHKQNLKTRQLHRGINRPEEIYEIALELLTLVKLTQDVRGIGISVGGLIKQRYTQLKIGELDKDRKLRVVEDLTFMLREQYGYGIVYDGVEGEKEKDEGGKVMRGLYLRI